MDTNKELWPVDDLAARGRAEKDIDYLKEQVKGYRPGGMKEAGLYVDGKYLGKVTDVEFIDDPNPQEGKRDRMSIEEYKQAELEKHNRLERGGTSKKPHHNRAYHKRKKPGKKTHRRKK